VILVLHIIIGAIEVLDLNDLLLDLGKFMLPINVIYRPCKVLQSLHLGLYFVEVMMVIHISSYRVVHLFECINLSVDLGKFVLPVYVVDRT